MNWLKHKLKAWIQDWLDIPDEIKITETINLPDYITKEEVKEIIQAAFREAFLPEDKIAKEVRAHYFGVDIGVDLRGEVDKCVKKLIHSHLANTVESKVNFHLHDIISQESLIDDIVKRINNKQVS